MLSSLLLLASSTAGEHAESVGHAANPIMQVLGPFGFDVAGFIAQVVNFAIVAFILWRFAFKPVLATIGERQKQIEAGLKYTEDMKIKLEQAQFESAAIIKAAQVESGKIIEESRRAAKEFYDKQTKEATEHATALQTKAQQAIQLEHKKMLDEARGEIARLVVSTTQRVLARELSDADKSRYNEAASRELTVV